MKIVITGSREHWAIENYFLRYLSEAGASCSIFDSAGRLSAYLSKGYVNKILFRAGFSGILKKINRELLEYVEKEKPDVVFVFKGIEILPATLSALRAKKVKLVNYNPDHPFIRTFRSSGGKNIEIAVPLYDIHFCYSRELAADIRNRFGIDTAWLPFGYELTENLYGELRNEQEVNRICFAGNPDHERAAFLDKLAGAGLPVDVYGHGWKRFLPPGTAVQIYDAVYGDEFWRTLRRYRVQLNLFRPHNAGSHNMRSFEVPAAGGIMLAPDTSEHRFFFEAGREIFLYEDLDDCLLILRDLIGRTATDMQQVREAARHRSVSEDYSYRRRAMDVYEKIKQR